MSDKMRMNKTGGHLLRMRLQRLDATLRKFDRWIPRLISYAQSAEFPSERKEWGAYARKRFGQAIGEMLREMNLGGRPYSLPEEKERRKVRALVEEEMEKSGVGWGEAQKRIASKLNLSKRTVQKYCGPRHPTTKRQDNGAET